MAIEECPSRSWTILGWTFGSTTARYVADELDKAFERLKAEQLALPQRSRTNNEAPAPIDQKAQPAAAGVTCQAVEAIEKKVRPERRTFEPSFSWLVPKIASYGF